MIRPLLRRRTTSGTAEFYLRHPENRLLVNRERDGGVLVCATADNLDREQQAAFVHYLNAEGFAPCELAPSDRLHERLPGLEEPTVRWIVDPSWPEVDAVYARHLQRLCWYLMGAMMVCLELVIALVCC